MLTKCFCFHHPLGAHCFDSVKGTPRCAIINGGHPHRGVDIDGNPPHRGAGIDGNPLPEALASNYCNPPHRGSGFHGNDPPSLRRRHWRWSPSLRCHHWRWSPTLWSGINDDLSLRGAGINGDPPCHGIRYWRQSPSLCCRRRQWSPSPFLRCQHRWRSISRWYLCGER